MMSNGLTVVIPTFNRNDVLAGNLKILLTIIDKYHRDVKVLIIDNASPVSVENTIGALLKLYQHVDIKIHRNNFNVGGNSNIPLALEYCSTKYAWILGDDDIAQPDSIKSIFNAIEKYPDFSFYNFDSCKPTFNSEISEDEEIISVGVDDFLIKTTKLNKVMFISDCVCNVEKIGPFLRFAMFYQNTCAPIICALLCQLSDNNKVLFSSKRLVEYGAENTPNSSQISVLPIALGLPKLLELPLKAKTLYLLKRHVRQALDGWIKPSHIINQLFLDCIKNNSWKESEIIFNNIRRNLFTLKKNPVFLFAMYLVSIFLKWPKLMNLTYPTVYSLVKKKDIECCEARDRNYL